MKRGAIIIVVWALMLITLLSSINLTQVAGLSSPAVSEAAVGLSSQEMNDPIASGSIRYHLATEADIQLMKERLIVPADDLTSAAAASSKTIYPTGLSTPTAEQLESLVGKIAIFDGYDDAIKSSAISSYDISTQPYFPIVGNQGTEGSCAAFAAIYYNYGYLEALDNDWSDAYLGNEEHLMSPSWAYNKVVLQDGGSFISHEAMVATTIGISTWNNMPYVNGDTVSWGNEEAWRNAPLHRADEIIYYEYDVSQTIQDIKDSVTSNHPVTIAIESEPINGEQTAFADSNYVLSSDEYYSTITDHAVTIVGFDDSIMDDGDVGAFKVANSWGAGFGDGGYFWITYEAIKEIGDLLQAMSLMDRIDYQPTDLAVYHFDYNAPSVDTTINFSAVRNSDDMVMKQITQFFVTDDDLYEIPSTFMCQDISELSGYLRDPLYRIEMHVSSSHLSGMLSSFRLEHCSSPYVDGKAIAISPEASGLPLDTPIRVSAQFPVGPIVTAQEALSYFDGALTFANDAQTQWVGVRDVQGRPHAMQSGDVGDLNNSTLMAWVRGPGTFSFDWKASCESGFDFLNASLDGAPVDSITGQTSWSTVTVLVPSGLHILSWSYIKDIVISEADDCGWIDNVVWDGSSVVFFEDFEPYELKDWYGTDLDAASGLDSWDVSTLWSATGTHSLWCAENGTGADGRPNHIDQLYDVNMDSYAQVELPDLTGIDAARLSFEYWASTDASDYAYVLILNGSGWSEIWTQPSGPSGGWVLVDEAIPAGTLSIAFCFISDGSAGSGSAVGVFIDDVLVTTSDDQPPLSSVDPLPPFTNDRYFDITVNASDPEGSGVAFIQLYYRLGGTGDFTMYTNGSNPSGLWAPGVIRLDTASLLGDGIYSFYSVATDQAGNRQVTTGSVQATTELDTTAPVTAASNSGNPAPGWNVGPVTVTLAPYDAQSGVASTYFRTDSDDWSAYSLPFVVAGEGVHSVQFYSVDNAGNAEYVKTLTVKMDEQDPVSTIGSSGVSTGWNLGSVYVSLTASDQVSGVQRIEYRLNNGSWINYTGNFPVTTQGHNTLWYAATDNAGNRELEQNILINIDSEAPVTIYALVGQHVPGSTIYVGDVTVTLTSEDTASGTADTFYSLDDGALVRYIGPFTVTSQGVHTLRFNSTDLASNSEPVNTGQFMIDRTAPTSSIALNGIAGTAGWFVGNATVNLTAVDGISGIGKIVYVVDDGVWTDYAGNFTVSGPGNHSVRYLAIDNGMNAENERSTVLRIDSVSPVTMIALSGTGNPDGIKFNGSVTVSFVSMDENSGNAATKWSVDGGAWATYSGAFVLSSEGVHELRFQSTDRAGNVEALRTVNITVDLTAPSSGLSFSGSIGTGGWYNGTVYAIWNPTDSLSGVQVVRYRLDGGDWVNATDTLMITADGSHTLDYYSVDNAGNAEPLRSVPFKLDMTMPTAIIHLDEGAAVDSSHLTVMVTLNDNLSGVASTVYRVDEQTYTSCIGDKIILTGLSDGEHTLTVKITDQAGNVAVQKVDFKVQPPKAWIDPLLGLILALFAIAALIVIAVVYVRKRRKGTG